MIMKQIANQWQDYECLDAGDGEKLERWKDIILRRPDPVALWPKFESEAFWQQAHAIYHRSLQGGGYWEYKKEFAKEWHVAYKDLIFKVSPTGFKHTGLFPEQASNWDFMQQMIVGCDHDVNILNLFAYTGGASLACSQANAKEVVHVDAAKGMVLWAKENMKLSHLENNRIRFIVDDVLKFVQREIRRGRKYHGIIMDPPSYGRGPNGELWKLEDSLLELVTSSLQLLDDDPLFFLINGYTSGLPISALYNILHATVLKRYPKGVITCGEMTLAIRASQTELPCGIYGRWQKA